ncbi:hypothetical protein SlGVgp102 [Spodoptera litura granulovirus]|uniref:Viral desmoplakin N-terminal domain-containing protein n=1 Tax=Spodoptera litura granulovirus TaxID=359919 RepID=A5IZV4_9BBAC|nr:hypothetical protein SlGVgp102 [Spodoptera litura granulovirus]ABQ52045.1 hypothetical protein SlGVgp102 [Spodoptera litura granulovirus]
MLTRYRGVDINQNTVNNLIRTIVNQHGPSSTDCDSRIRSILFSHRPDLIKKLSNLPTESLLIRCLQDNNKKEISYNYNYNTTNTSSNSGKNNKYDDEDDFVGGGIVSLKRLPQNITLLLQDVIVGGWSAEKERSILKLLLTYFDDGIQYINLFTSTTEDFLETLNKHWRLNGVDSRSMLQLLDAMRSTIVPNSISTYSVDDMMEMCNKDEKEVLLREVAELEERLERVQTQRNMYENESNKYRAQISMSENEIAKLNYQLLEKNKSVEELYKECEDVKIQYNTLKSEYNMMSEQVKNLFNEVSRLKTEVSIKNDESDKFRTALAEARGINSVLMEKNASSDDANLIRAQYLDKCNETDLLKHDIAKYLGIIEELQKQIDRLKVVNDEDEIERDKLLQEVSRCGRLEQELAMVKDLNSKLSEENKTLIAQTIEAEDSVERINQSYNLKQGELNKTRVELDNIMKNYREVRQKLEEAEKEINEKDKTIDYCNYEIETLSAANSQIKRKVPKRKKELTWDVNKLYGVKSEQELNDLIASISVKNRKSKNWSVYEKFLNAKPVSVSELKQNPEFDNLDEDFVKLLEKKNEFETNNTYMEEENSLFSN